MAIHASRSHDHVSVMSHRNAAACLTAACTWARPVFDGFRRSPPTLRRRLPQGAATAALPAPI
eukprot:6171957-Pleurochrysis_carterae.AAC.7